MASDRHGDTERVFAGPACSFRNFRRDYNEDDDHGLFFDAYDSPSDGAAAAGGGPGDPDDVVDACRKRDADDLQGDDADSDYDDDDDDDDDEGSGDEEGDSYGHRSGGGGGGGCGGGGGKGRKRRFYSCSSSSQSPYRSCKSSLSPQNSASYYREERPGDSDGEDPEKNRDFSSEENNSEDDDDEDYFGFRKIRAKSSATDAAAGAADASDATASERQQRSNGSSSRNSSYGSLMGKRRQQQQEAKVSIPAVADEDDEEGWKELPVILLEDIFVMLTPKQRHEASQVCRPWYEIFYSPRVWETFVLLERTLTRRRFNLYKGYQREMCPRKTQLCLMRVGCFFKRIVVTPISDYYNLYEFLRVLAAFLTYYADFPMPLLHTFRFTFACESRGVNGVAIIGTGGNILEKVKDLLGTMQHLRHLALNQLLLDVEEVSGLLAAAAKNCIDTLFSLELLNCSKIPIPVYEVTEFSHLTRLKLSPQHLSDELVLLLGGKETLDQLHVVQDAYTCACSPVPGEAWKLFKEMAPHKRVFLEIEGRTKTPLMLQPHAPVHGIVFRTPYHRLHAETTTWVVEYYGKFLEYFVQETLPRSHGSRKFAERADESFLRLARECPNLHTLMIRERISLATLLMIAQEGKARKLKWLLVRKNALIKKCEWPKAKNWTQDYYRWLKRHGRNYDLAYEEMPRVLKQRWKPTVDRVFKRISLPIS